MVAEPCENTKTKQENTELYTLKQLILICELYLKKKKTLLASECKVLYILSIHLLKFSVGPI